MTAPTETSTKRVALYARISHDAAGDAHGVTNQTGEAELYAGRHPWQVVARYCDNDISATSGARRPGYEAMMAAAARREFDAIVVFQTSRLWRSRRERADGIETLRQAGISVIAVKGPSLDMSTAYGRAMAGLLGEFDTMETDVKAERQRLANAAAARDGLARKGTPRPFGSESDHITHRPAEAAAVVWAADAMLGGASIKAIAREWTARGLNPPQAPAGKPWTSHSVTAILRNPRVAGLRTYVPSEERKRLAAAKETIRLEDHIVGPGEWEPIIPEETWRAVVNLLRDPGRKVPRGVRTMLGGLARCPCGAPVQGGRNARGKAIYRCAPARRGGRHGPHVQQMSGPVDEYVAAVIVARLSRPDLAELIAPKRPDLSPLHTEAQSIRTNLDQLAADMVAGLISRSQMIAATQAGNRRLDAITAELAAAASISALTPFTAAQPAQTVWDGLDGSRRRAVIDALAQVVIHPAGRGARTFNPDTISIEWRRG